MNAKSYSKGHKIEYQIDKGWVYSDNKESIDKERVCKRCGNRRKDGIDYCIGKLKNIRAACCGHGQEEPYVMYEDGTVEEFKDVGELKNKTNPKRI